MLGERNRLATINAPSGKGLQHVVCKYLDTANGKTVTSESSPTDTNEPPVPSIIDRKDGNPSISEGTRRSAISNPNAG